VIILPNPDSIAMAMTPNTVLTWTQPAGFGRPPNTQTILNLEEEHLFTVSLSSVRLLDRLVGDANIPLLGAIAPVAPGQENITYVPPHPNVTEPLINFSEKNDI